MMAAAFINEILGADTNTIKVEPKGIPLWITKSVSIYEARLTDYLKIYLVKPVKSITFDQTVNILEQIQKRLRGVVLLIADEVNPRYRALFVKNGVPFVYKDKSIYAPKLGLKLFDYKRPQEIKNQKVASQIAPFELKLLAGYLTGFIVQEGFNLKQLEEILLSNNYQSSKSKLSIAVKNLIELGYLKVKGSGPNRLVRFKNRDEVWEHLKEQNIKPFYKVLQGYYMDDVPHIFSGETALAFYSDLAEPKTKYIGLTNQELKELEKNGKPVGDFGNPLYMLEVHKEPAQLFAVDEKYLNPIELYFILRDEDDERVQLSIEQMLDRYNLKA